MLEERRKIGVPGSGEWFNKKNIAKEFASMHYGTGGGFVLGFDLPMRGYCYGVYASYDESITYLLQLKSDCRHGYEMIRSENECNLYLDLELICKEEDETEIMERTVESICAILRLKYKAEFGLQVTRGSGVTEKEFKLSFHVVVTGLVFSNNYGRGMKQCVQEIRDSLDKNNRQIIDVHPYNRDGLMRTVLSCQRSSPICLRNVTGNPFGSTRLYSQTTSIKTMKRVLEEIATSHNMSTMF